MKALWIKIKMSFTIHCDNLVANYVAKNPIFHSRAKHAAISYHFFREQIAESSIKVKYIGTKEQLTDILTKPYNTSIFDYLKTKSIVILPH